MFNVNTPIHMAYTSITCPCAQCENDRNRQTARLPRLTKPDPRDRTIYERVTVINSETWKRTVYYWPIRQKY